MKHEIENGSIVLHPVGDRKKGKEMLKEFDIFREKLDRVIHKCMDKRIVLYGYGYSGKFVGWYAEYYHSMKPDYIITQDMTSNIPYEFELYRESLFDFNYKDVKDAVVWLCIPETEEIRNRLTSHNYVKGQTYFDICEAVYGLDYAKKVNGASAVQPLTFLEYTYGCDFVTRIGTEEFKTVMEGMHPYVTTTPKEILPILDKCHCHPRAGDAIFDFGCGKGSAMLTFLDYGFPKVGGVEYEDGIYGIMEENFRKLKMDPHSGKIECIHGDAARITAELDAYNWFYFFDPFERNIFGNAIQNICESIKRKPRKAYIINILPRYHEVITDTEMFILTNQFDIMSRQRVVDVFVTKQGYEEP